MKYYLFLLLLLTYNWSSAQKMKGFDLSNASIPVEEIKDGGPPKDGIPALDYPKFKKISALTIDPQTRILGVRIKGVAKAYPIPIMNYHEIVNDEFAGQPVVVTYCPLCNSGIAFDASIDQGKRSFGVSGLLYNSDVLLYDRQTESLWSQIMMKAVSGPLVGEELEMIPTMNTTLGAWKRKYPETLVLTEETTGFNRNYQRNPYQGYQQSAKLYFDVENKDSRFHPKEMVLGIEVNGQFKAYPFSELAKFKEKAIKDQIAGQELIIHFEPQDQSAIITNSTGEEVPALATFWFAWYSFHPETEVFEHR